MKKKREPSWISLSEVLAFHEQLLALHGGLLGVRDMGLLESAIARPKNSWLYEGANIISLAAIYADGIVNNHCFIDGNKRTGLVTAIVFLETNGYLFSASEEEAVTMTLALAARTVHVREYAAWIGDNSAVRRKNTERRGRK